jgi:hypothetical protein
MPDRTVEGKPSQSVEQVRPPDMTDAAEGPHQSTVRPPVVRDASIRQNGAL